VSGIDRRSFPVVLAAPSGTGKTTLARALVDRFDDFEFSVSVTTRPPRGTEADGVDYHFVDGREFERMMDHGELAEWAEVHGHLYGTPRAELDAAARRKEYVILDIDVQGALQVRRSTPEAVLVFVLPPSVDTLLERLQGRGTEDAAHVARRLQSAMEELQHATDFDHVVVNDDFQRCLGEIRGIVEGEALRTHRAPGLRQQAEELRAGIARVLRNEYANANG
jgi:guanylate kinase